MAGKNIHIWNEGNFEQEVLNATEPVLVDFTATWCGPCKMLAPIVEKIADDYVGKVKVGKVDIDDAPQLAARFGVRSVPTVMVFQAGQRKATHVGLTKREKLVELIGL